MFDWTMSSTVNMVTLGNIVVRIIDRFMLALWCRSINGNVSMVLVTFNFQEFVSVRLAD